ncbi:MAG: hypothetical protein ACLPUT_09320 [Solirubrobacteraceae bacterium]
MRPRPRSLAASPLARALPLALALALAATLAGCGGSSPSGNGVASRTPAQIVAAAKAAAAGAATVHVAGSIVGEGQPISLNMELVAGKGGRGRIALAGLAIQLIDVDRSLYINGSASFYSRFAGPAAARRLQGKWLKGPAERGPLRSLASLTDLGELIDSTLAGHGTLTRGAATTIGGRAAVGVTDPARGGTLYVATTGAPYPLEIVKAGADGGRIVFDRWNKPVTLAAPANPINIKQLQSGR